MEKCALCGAEITGIQYVLPNISNKFICQKCNDCVSLCIANENNESTQSARTFLNAQVEKSIDADVINYLLKVLQIKSNEGSDSVAADEKNPTSKAMNCAEETGLFGNIGNTVKAVTKVFFWIEVVLCVFVGFVLISENSYRNPTAGPGFVFLLAGPLVAWLGSLFLYGFGELIEQSRRQNQLLSELINISNKNKK